MGKQAGAVSAMGAIGAMVAVAVFGVGACSKSSDTPGKSSVAGSAGGGGAPAVMGGSSSGGTAGSAAAGKPSTGPAISTAPAAWAPPTDCGGVGDTCPEGIFGCTSPTSSCQLEGYVCIPAFDAKKGLPSRTAETPYCAAYTCMTFEQASCFCTGEAGKADSRCVSPSAMAGLCGTDGSSCDAATDIACCDGFACLPEAYYPQKSCRKTCTSNDECASGCCTDALDTGTKICAPASQCETACKKEGEQECSLNDPNKPTLCCRGTCVDSENLNYAGCRPRCTKNEDCFETGCCEPFSNSTDGFCVDAKFCTCGNAGAACAGDDTPPCCSGTTCVTFEQEGASFSCFQNCATDADCPGSCCVSLSSGNGKVCGPPGNCP
jgi:hypothetical protein